MNREYIEEYKKFIQKKSDKERYLQFEHELKFLIDSINDDNLFIRLQHIIIVYGMNKEDNKIYLDNLKKESYNIMNTLKEKHGCVTNILIIQWYMEDYYFNK